MIGRPSTRASIQVKRPPVGALGQQAVGRIDADAEAGAGQVVVDDAEQVVGQLGGRSSSPVTRNVPVDRVQEPQRAVDGVVLRAAGVGGVRQHPLRQRRRRPHAAARVPRRRGRWPGAAPRRRSWCRGTSRRTTGSRRRRSGPVDDELVRGQRELRAGLVVGSARRAMTSPSPGRGPRRRWPSAGGGGDAGRRPRPSTSAASPGRSSAAKRPAYQRSSTGFSPRAASSRCAHSPVPAPAGLEPRAARRGRRPRT